MELVRYSIIGGAKTAANLKAFLDKNGIANQLYFFDGEYAAKRKIGQLFNQTVLEQPGNCIITSETAFQNIPKSKRDFYKNHYHLRDKRNLDAIAKKIESNYIKELKKDDQLSFPIIAKPVESSGGKVPFKFKVIDNEGELSAIDESIDYCILQPYLDRKHYNQLAVAGYFDGTPGSLMAAKQFSQYPIGVSALVVNFTSHYQKVIQKVAAFLNEIGYKGFIEFEFKENKLDSALYLMDINPRTWGWSNYYLEAIQNFPAVLEGKASIQLKLKKAWINTPRWILSLRNGTFKRPQLKWLVKNDISYEPYF